MYAFSLSKLDKLEKEQNKSLKQTITQSSSASKADDSANKPVEGEDGSKFVSILGRLIIDQYGKPNQTE